MNEPISVFNPWVIALAVGLAVWALCASRRTLATPVLVAGCWTTFGQAIDLFDLNLPTLRIVVLAALIRMVLAGPSWLQTLPRPDRAFLVWVGLRVLTFWLLFLNAGALVNRLGHAFDAIGIYFCFRYTVRDSEDVIRLIRTVLYLLIPIAVLMTIERLSGINHFHILGGVAKFSALRNGTVRAQGPFTHPILAGTVGAVWSPAFLCLWKYPGGRVAAVVGLITSMVIIATSASSGPVMTLGGAIVALALWPMRHRMGMVRGGIVVVLLLLQVVMSRPIWFLFARVNVLSGSTGWHRANLIDQSVRHISEWFLLGVPDSRIESWGVFAGDITNHYLFEGLRGGILPMAAFVFFLVQLYAAVGRAIAREELLPPHHRAMVWCLGAALTAHAAAFFSVAYFTNQSMLHFYATAALVVSLSSELSGLTAETVLEERPS